jgi:hypothetical protein
MYAFSLIVSQEQTTLMPFRVIVEQALKAWLGQAANIVATSGVENINASYALI